MFIQTLGRQATATITLRQIKSIDSHAFWEIVIGKRWNRLSKFPECFLWPCSFRIPWLNAKKKLHWNFRFSQKYIWESVSTFPNDNSYFYFNEQINEKIWIFNYSFMIFDEHARIDIYYLVWISVKRSMHNSTACLQLMTCRGVGRSKNPGGGGT